MAAPPTPETIATALAAMKGPAIPTRSSEADRAIYHTLLQTAATRRTNGTVAPHVVVVTDLAKDYDDLLAMTLLKELHRLGLIVLEGFVANLNPAITRARFGRGALDCLGLPDIPIGIGTAGSENDPVVYGYEFDCHFMAGTDREYEHGFTLLSRLFSCAVQEQRQLTLLCISSLRDANEFVVEQPELFRNAVNKVVIQGGYDLVDDVLTARTDAANNTFDQAAANNFHTFLGTNNIETVCYTKVATGAVELRTQVFVDMDESGHIVGAHLRRCEVEQDVVFYERACSARPFAPFMTQSWFLNLRSSFFQRHGHTNHPNELIADDGTALPVGRGIQPYLEYVLAYDALAALHTAGEDVVRALQVLDTEGLADDPIMHKRPYNLQGTIHKLVGWAGRDKMPAVIHIRPESMRNALGALLRGSVYNSMEVLPPPSFWKRAYTGRLSGHDLFLICIVVTTTAALYSVLANYFGVNVE